MTIEGQFSRIYQEYYNKAFRYANLYVRNDLVAEDIATEALLKLWQTMKQEPIEKPASLLMVILKNKSLDYLKVQSHAQEAYEAMENWRQRELAIRISTLEVCDPEKILSDEIRSILRETLHKLPEQTRRVFVMSRFEHKSGKEIAGILNISVKGVDYHIAKALNALRVSLKDYLPLLSFWFVN